jgi:hypothetical protein
MTRLTILAAATVAGCASLPPAATPAPSPVTGAAPAAKSATNMYSRIPAQIGTFMLRERAIVRGLPTDSVFRFGDASTTTLTVIIYPIPDDIRVEADSQKWTWREGEKFRLVQQIRAQRRAIREFSPPVSDTTRIANGARMIQEHWIIVPTKLNSGAVVVEFQYLYLIDGKFLKVRATVPHETWQDSKVPSFARELAKTVAGGPS